MSRAKSESVDWTSCLHPFEGEPCGPPLQNDPICTAIREARREDNPDLPQGVWERELKRADWDQALSLSLGVLRERSKDIQVAGWACEAALMRDGFVALPGGLRMIAQLCSVFGDGLHPQPEGEDQEARLARLVWLDTTLVDRVASLPITEAASGISGVAYADWRRMEHHERLQNGNGKDVRRSLELAGTQTAPSFHAALHEHIVEALSALDELVCVADVLCGGQAPSFHMIHDLLERIDVRIRAWHPAVESKTPSFEIPLLSSVSSYSSREQAYASLAAIADYLMHTEPHSPAPWLVKRAVSWGGMSLTELLDELLGQGESLASIRKLLGMTKE